MKGTGTGQTFLQVLLSLAFLLLAGISTYGQQKRVIAGPKGFPYMAASWWVKRFISQDKKQRTKTAI